MGKISAGRVIAGGLAAGLVINIIEFLVNGWWLAGDWEKAMRDLGKSAATSGAMMTMYIVWGFLMGIVAVWFYAAIRPRFGPGSKTAVIAALAVWIPGNFLAMVPPMIMDILPERLVVIGLVVGVIELIAATQVGACLYKE